ncbi:MAG: hypothetical protein RM021_026500 [Nostoc sp. EkiNYC01]
MKEYFNVFQMVFYQREKLLAENADFASRPSDVPKLLSRQQYD